MRERIGLVARLVEYGLLLAILHKGLLIVGSVLYFTIASGILTYTISVNEPIALGKTALLSLLLLLSTILARLVPSPARTFKLVETKKRKGLSTRESLTVVISLLIILVIVVLSYTMMCFFRIY